MTNAWRGCGRKPLSRGCVVNVASLGARVVSWRRYIAGGGCALVGYSIVRCTERIPIQVNEQVDEQFGVAWLSSAASLRFGTVIDVFPHILALCQPDLAQASQQGGTVGIGTDNLVQPRLEGCLLPLAGRKVTQIHEQLCGAVVASGVFLFNQGNDLFPDSICARCQGIQFALAGLGCGLLFAGLALAGVVAGPVE
jgi:hypothetical protein